MRKLILIIVLSVTILFVVSCEVKLPDRVYEEGSYWIDGYFQQQGIVTPQPGVKTIEALVEGTWREFELQDFPESFMEWNINKRIDTLGRFRNMQPPELAGPHNGVVATYGIRRGDTEFKLNNAVKGMGFLPKYEKLLETIELLENTKNEEFAKKLNILEELYENAEEIFDKDKQVSLELYSTPEFETQTFLNQMTNPISTIVFLDIPTFKLKTIVRLLHPDDPDLTEYEQLIIRYVNEVYRFFHGGRDTYIPTVVYYVVEVYDSSPGRPDARGLRVDSE
ncbi:MAG: hypothetical protein K0B81_04840 [Candidatus Cloacimonetes bacterium]|nr:hypothetical protein [Candidatus Cloacimonadota bacterium]